jgi:hypothetical protein
MRRHDLLLFQSPARGLRWPDLWQVNGKRQQRFHRKRAWDAFDGASHALSLSVVISFSRDSADPFSADWSPTGPY